MFVETNIEHEWVKIKEFECKVCRKSNLDNFEIIKKYKSHFEAKVKEALYIKKIIQV